VVGGRGRTVVQEKGLAWQKGDTFVVPGWSWSEHHAEEDAILFAMSDEPVLRATCLYRRECAGDNAPSVDARGRADA
jgi:gentisate 1,2-dioxygenase